MSSRVLCFLSFFLLLFFLICPRFFSFSSFSLFSSLFSSFFLFFSLLLSLSHGASVADLDENSMFYLAARGIDRREARKLLLTGFMLELLEEYIMVKYYTHFYTFFYTFFEVFFFVDFFQLPVFFSLFFLLLSYCHMIPYIT